MIKTKNTLLSLVLLASLFACNGKDPKKPEGEKPTVPLTSGLAQSEKGNVLAKVNGESITEEDVMKLIKPRIARIESQLFEIKRDAIDQIIENRLLEAEAKKRNISIQELVKKEIQDKVGEISDKEISDFYNQIKARVGDKTLEQLKPQIVGQLRAQKASKFRDNFLDRLMAKADVDIYIKRPAVEVGVGKSPSKGGTKTAPVTLIEFTDFECPFCGRVRPTIKQVLETYKNDIHYVQRQFPLDFHRNAKKAGEASLCANDQKKYWEYADKLWENQRALDVESLKKYADELKLDKKKFEDCLNSNKYAAQVEEDQREGAKAGVTGTPAFFINGKLISGAQPFEAFKKSIDEELREAKRKKN